MQFMEGRAGADAGAGVVARAASAALYVRFASRNEAPFADHARSAL